MVVTVILFDDFNLTTMTVGSVVYLLAATLYHWNHDGYHKLWNINPLSLKSWWVPQALEYRINWEIYITYDVSVYILLECSQMGKLKASLLSMSFVFKRPYVFALETENLSGFIRNSCVSIDMSEIQTLFLHWLCKSRFHYTEDVNWSFNIPVSPIYLWGVCAVQTFVLIVSPLCLNCSCFLSGSSFQF